MDAIETITAPVTVLMRDDIDTDQIIPARYMKRVERTGFGEFCFHEWRANGARPPAQPDPRHRRELRLRVEPRARARGR